ncbi:hypothetical protein Tco_0662280 [Tanacetum coccineum]
MSIARRSSSTSYPKNLETPTNFSYRVIFLEWMSASRWPTLCYINRPALSVWKKLSLPELTPTCMTLELADRSITQPIGIAEDVYVKCRSTNSWPTTRRALIDVSEGELTLRVGKEAVTFNLDQNFPRYSSNYEIISSRQSHSYYTRRFPTSSPTLTPFGDSDFLLEEIERFPAQKMIQTSPEVDSLLL